MITQILAAQPGNLAALFELSRIGAKRGDTATLRSAAERIGAQSAAWPQDARDQSAQLQAAATTGPPAAAAIRSVFLRNVPMQVPSFRESLAQIEPAPDNEAPPFTHLLRPESPPSRPAPSLPCGRAWQPRRRNRVCDSRFPPVPQALRFLSGHLALRSVATGEFNPLNGTVAAREKQRIR